jgi:hypothetical protein
MPKTAYIHIGMHKTGTTSIQHFMQEQRGLLRANGFDFYQGMVFKENHVELHAASMRPERESGYKNRVKLLVDKKYIDDVKQHVRQFIDNSPCDNLVFSSEGLSLLRFPDEVNRLQDLIQVEETKVIVFLRDPSSYLRSLKKQHFKHLETVPEVIEKDSFAYTEADSWLVDYKMRLAPFKDVFGVCNIVEKSYDAAQKEQGNVIPQFLEAINALELFPQGSWNAFFLNKSV